jgi:nucleotide-binding universal stress UspA family protein
LITNKLTLRTKGRFSKIVVAIDGSQASMDAADYAIEMSKKDGSQLTALTIIHTPLSSYGLVTPQDELRHPKEREEMLEAKEWFDKLIHIAKQNDVQLKTEVVDSQMSIEAAIVEYAESYGADLIIIGTRGRSGFKKMLLGSVASGVVTYATCPVMVVK